MRPTYNFLFPFKVFCCVIFVSRKTFRLNVAKQNVKFFISRNTGIFSKISQKWKVREIKILLQLWSVYLLQFYRKGIPGPANFTVYATSFWPSHGCVGQTVNLEQMATCERFLCMGGREREREQGVWGKSIFLIYLKRSRMATTCFYKAGENKEFVSVSCQDCRWKGAGLHPG